MKLYFLFYSLIRFRRVCDERRRQTALFTAVSGTDSCSRRPAGDPQLQRESAFSWRPLAPQPRHARLPQRPHMTSGAKASSLEQDVEAESRVKSGGRTSVRNVSPVNGPSGEFQKKPPNEQKRKGEDYLCRITAR
ncbi:hypothetical protein PDJAM_G00259940 [Pangasius djambal]|nr:hypothetical protein [Pangasius djambal]